MGINTTGRGEVLMGMYAWKDDEKVTVEMDEKRLNRFVLNCTWDEGRGKVTFILCNPSIGDEGQADLTLRRCVNYARNWGYGSLDVVNLFSQITTDPSALIESQESRQGENDSYIIRSIEEADRVIFGWGEVEKRFPKRAGEVKALVPTEKQFCLSRTANGKYPRHPSRLRRDLLPVSWG